jgi:hypothetical protein
LFTAVLFAVLAIYATYRATVRPALPWDETGNYVPIYPAVAMITAEIAHENAVTAQEKAQEDT